MDARGLCVCIDTKGSKHYPGPQSVFRSVSSHAQRENGPCIVRVGFQHFGAILPTRIWLVGEVDSIAETKFDSGDPGTLLLNLIERHLIETCWMKPTGRHLLVRYKEDQDTVDALRKPSLHRIEKIGEPIALCDFRNGTFADAIAEFSQIPGEDWVRPYLRGFAISQILMERDSQFFAVGIWSKGVSRYFNPEGLGGWSTLIFILIPRKRNSTKP